MSIVIDGRQLVGSLGGVQRFVRELVSELDKIVEPGEYEILMPRGSIEGLSRFENIPVHQYGFFKGLLWEQTCLPWYLLFHKKLGLFPCTIVPLLYPKGLTVLHDIMVKTVPEVRDAIANPLAKTLLLINYWVAAKHSKVLVTVSEFSKHDISLTYNVDFDKIFVVSSGWEHVFRVKADDSWREKYPQLLKGEYYFALSANRTQKNFIWIKEVAQRNPQSVFAIAGGDDEWQTNLDYGEPTNVVRLGYVSDATMRSLIENCKAFLFPSIYEGFGIPPLEALALGAQVIVSNASCLPEIYEDCVHYIDPYKYDVDIERLLQEPVAPASKVLNKRRWDILAKRINELVQTMKQD